MTISDSMLNALIAAGVSLVVSLAGLIASLSAMRFQRQKLDKELARRFTEKLYDLRLASYPKAFEITDKLRGDVMLGGKLRKEDAQKIREELLEWNRSKAAFLMSKDALRAFYQIRSALDAEPEREGSYSKKQLRFMWSCKNRLRGLLKADINLLYEEETLLDE